LPTTKPVGGRVSSIGFMETVMRKIVVLSLVAAALAVSACNTISGIGRDVSAAGSAVSQSAEQAKR